MISLILDWFELDNKLNTELQEISNWFKGKKLFLNLDRTGQSALCSTAVNALKRDVKILKKQVQDVFYVHTELGMISV